MDVTSIGLGLDFGKVLEETLARCKAMVVVIGKDWEGEFGSRRLYRNDDFVRIEIETALKRDIFVIPILVDGTAMPEAVWLPDSIKALTRRNGCDVSSTARFNADCEQLVKTLRQILKS
jgi:hypothetical protein